MESYRSGHNELHSKCSCPFLGTWVRIPHSPLKNRPTDDYCRLWAYFLPAFLAGALSFKLLYSNTKCGIERNSLFSVLKPEILCGELDRIGWLIGFHVKIIVFILIFYTILHELFEIFTLFDTIHLYQTPPNLVNDILSQYFKNSRSCSRSHALCTL